MILIMTLIEKLVLVQFYKVKKKNKYYHLFIYYKIEFIFKRRYIFRRNALEFFTTEKKSYLFQLQEYEKNYQI